MELVPRHAHCTLLHIQWPKSQSIDLSLYRPTFLTIAQGAEPAGLKPVDITNIVSIAVAALAVAISLIALLTARQHQRFDAILRIEDFMRQEAAIEGRRLLYEASRQGTTPF
jgi:hypothetical protein